MVDPLFLLSPEPVLTLISEKHKMKGSWEKRPLVLTKMILPWLLQVCVCFVLRLLLEVILLTRA